MPKAVAGPMNHLWDVGWKKPMGYLPLKTIKKSGWKIEAVIERARAAHHETAVFAEDECHIVSGALYVWHPAAVQRLLDLNSEILEGSGWPKDASAFTKETSFRFAEGVEIYDLVGAMFADARMDGSPHVRRIAHHGTESPRLG